MPNLGEPIFTVATRNGRMAYSLFGLMAATARGEVVDLPEMAAHQRAPVVTTLAIMMHVLARHADVDRTSDENWAAAWGKLIGPDALRLVAPHDEVAFLQPPTDRPKYQQSIEDTDCLLAGVEHEVKGTWSTVGTETAVFSLMGGLSRPSVNFYRTSTRTGLCAVLPSIDGTLGSEICSLVTAYDRLNLPAEGSAADHFVWLRPYRPADDTIPFADLPRPFLDIGRAQRLVKTGDGFEVWVCPNNTYRVTKGDLWLDDPHTPRVTDKDGTQRYKLAAKVFDHRFQHHVLFAEVGERSTIDRPRILDLVDYRYVRLCALGTDQGKTKGYHDALFVAAPSDGFFTLPTPAPEDRPARLSASALATIEAGSKVLYSALATLYRDTDDDLNVTDKSRIARAQSAYHNAVRHASVQAVFDLLHSPEDASAEQQRFDALVAAQVRQAFHRAATALLRPLHVARAEHRLEFGIHFKLKGERMSPKNDRPLLARQTFAILLEVTDHATPDDRARLRTMPLWEPPLSFWKIVAAVPREQVDDEQCLAIWKVVLRALGKIRHTNSSLGKTLAVQDFPEDRMDRLLTASGTAMPGLIDEALRWLVSHGVEAADLSALATLGLSDAIQDSEARDWARKQIALDYVRAVDAKARRNGNSQTTQI